MKNYEKSIFLMFIGLFIGNLALASDLAPTSPKTSPDAPYRSVVLSPGFISGLSPEKQAKILASIAKSQAKRSARKPSDEPTSPVGSLVLKPYLEEAEELKLLFAAYNNNPGVKSREQEKANQAFEDARLRYLKKYGPDMAATSAYQRAIGLL